MKCGEATKWLSPFLDGEIEAGRLRPIREHLAGCPACREEHRLLREVKELVREKAPRERAPARLREQVLQGLAKEREGRALAGRGRNARRSPLRSLPALAAAAVALLFLVVAYYRLFEVPATSLAEGFVREHLQYEVGQPLPEQRGADPRQLAARLRDQVDFALKVPDLRGLDVTLLGGRVLSLEGKRVAHLLYGRPDHNISLFVLKGDEMRLPLEKVTQGGTTFRVGGYREMALVFWREGELSHLLICQGRQRAQGLMRCALLVREQAGSP